MKLNFMGPVVTLVLVLFATTSTNAQSIIDANLDTWILKQR